MKKLKKIISGAIIVQAIGMSSMTFASNYEVIAGDSFWKISQKLNIGLNDLMQANNAGSDTIIYPGQKIKVPGNGLNIDSSVNIEENKVNQTISTNDSKYGEALDWFEEVQYIIPRGTEFKVTDFYTGKTFMLYRSVGTNHADVEALTAQDTAIIKEIWGGDFSWVRRPVIVEIEGRKIAASLAPMPHAGNDNVPGGQHTSWRSGGYEAGTNLDYIKGNDMHGVMDLHFLNSLGHGNPVKNPDHQRSVKIAAGIS